MSDREEPLAGNQRLTELFSALKEVVAENPHIQEMIRHQEQDKRQVLLNMSSVLRMVEQDGDEFGEPEAVFEPKAVTGWLGPDGLTSDDGADMSAASTPAPSSPAMGVVGELNFFDRAFLKSLKISL